MNSINAAGWQAEHLGQHAGGGLIRGFAILLDHEGQLTGQELLFYDALLAAGVTVQAFTSSAVFGPGNKNRDGVLLTLLIAPKE